VICLTAIFLPSFFLAIGPLPFWNWFRQHPAMRSVLKGVNAAVVGLLLAALYNPVWTSAIHAPADFVIGIVTFLLLTLWAAPPCLSWSSAPWARRLWPRSSEHLRMAYADANGAWAAPAAKEQ
jgi:chromate transporter